MKTVLLFLALTIPVLADRCPVHVNVAPGSVTGNQRVITLKANGRPTVICSIDISWASGTVIDLAIVSGTGTDCATGTVTQANLAQLTSWSKSWGTDSPLIIPAGRDVCLNFSGTVTPKGLIKYGQ